MPAKFVSCPLCGQGFGSASIGIHVPQCYDKALKRWQLDPRGPKPVMPVRGLSTGTMKGGSPGASSMPNYGNTGGHGAGNSSMPVPLRSTLNQRQQQLRLPTEDPYPDHNPNLHPCRKCQRTFAFDRIAYHESVCKGNKQRKPFNSKKQRLSDFDEFEIRATARGGGGAGRTVRGGAGGGRAPPLDTRQSGATSWRRQHADFISAIRSAKQHQSQVTALQKKVQPQRDDLGGGRRQPRQPFASNALRQPDIYRSTANRAAAGGGALGPRQNPQFPQQAATSRTVKTTPAGSGRGAVNAMRNVGGGGGFALGGPSNAGAYGGGAPNYRIQNTNQTSSAMLQAMGRY
ncbi:zinc finger protein, putative [Bodo saltans]|uniref:Zinc finger protein, putative n=1 Tax=Bodo saltans TaxID=75058 RepID=A0A0S4JLV6_BODSA|nr:zinc finger protein, putative [Bodo saltans]|eukprot:CUG91208.1 zinc finger protein, putative [Bodo saltans]